MLTRVMRDVSSKIEVYLVFRTGRLRAGRARGGGVVPLRGSGGRARRRRTSERSQSNVKCLLTLLLGAGRDRITLMTNQIDRWQRVA